MKRIRFVILLLSVLTGLICIMGGMHYAVAEESLFVSDSVAQDRIIRSGDYGYQVIDEEAKTASLRKIYNYGEKVVIPVQIDGYRIYDIGKYDSDSHNKDKYVGNDVIDYDEATVFSKKDTIVKTLVIPEGLQGNSIYKNGGNIL